MTKDIKQEIKEAIQQFANGSLSENALALFNKLGYSSNKKIDFTKAEFERQFQNTKPPMRKRH